ncbi:putative translation initiation inhibitor, yjgF family [Opitutaceae bacterium TAV1]|nr:putative translation initiation inhibitor, yjgF family [Opitutaceae bacterium TAV1]
MISGLSLNIYPDPVQRLPDPRWQIAHVNVGSHGLYAITGNDLSAEDLGAPLEAILAERDAVRAAQYVFGSVPDRSPLAASGVSLVSAPFPVAGATLLGGQRGGRKVSPRPVSSAAIAAAPLSTQLYAISPAAAVTPVIHKGRRAGIAFEDTHARYCLLGDITADDPAASRSVQCRQLFENMEGALAVAGLAFTDIVRTWLYVDAILDWYDTLNQVRTRFFNERGVFAKRVPASTGIGAANARGTAIVASLLAVRPRAAPAAGASSAPVAPLTIRPLRSPLQCSAEDYGSSFSRAIEIARPDGGAREICISGTASIEPGGQTVHVGDVEKQIALSMEVVAAILADQQLGWANVSRAIAYFRDLEKDLPRFRGYLAAHGLGGLPVVCMQADICRDDLLFEIEADAFSPGAPA